MTEEDKKKEAAAKDGKTFLETDENEGSSVDPWNVAFVCLFVLTILSLFAYLFTRKSKEERYFTQQEAGIRS